MEESGCLINSNQLKHNFYYDKKVINLNIIQEKDNFKFDFNFHFEIKNLVEFKKLLNENKILEMKQIAINILNNVYEVG